MKWPFKKIPSCVRVKMLTWQKLHDCEQGKPDWFPWWLILQLLPCNEAATFIVFYPLPFRPLPCLLIFSGCLLVRGCKWCSSLREIPEKEMGQFSWKNISAESHAMYDGFLYKIQCDLIIIYWFNPVYSQKLPYKFACEGEIYRGYFMS